MTKKDQSFRTVTRDMTKKKAAQLAVNVVEFQKATLGNSIKLLGKAQEQTGRILHDMLKNAAWVPSEGREVVDEWNQTMKRAREEFHKTSDKSFDLILHYLERVQKEEGGRTAGVKPSAAKPAPKKPAPRKPAAKKPAVTKKPAVKNAAAKQAAAKKPAARKKAPAKPPAANEE